MRCSFHCLNQFDCLSGLVSLYGGKFLYLFRDQQHYFWLVSILIVQKPEDDGVGSAAGQHKVPLSSHSPICVGLPVAASLPIQLSSGSISHVTGKYRQPCPLKTGQGLDIVSSGVHARTTLECVESPTWHAHAIWKYTIAENWGLAGQTRLDASYRGLSVSRVEQVRVRLSTKRCCLLFGLAPLSPFTLPYCFIWFLLFNTRQGPALSTALPCPLIPQFLTLFLLPHTVFRLSELGSRKVKFIQSFTSLSSSKISLSRLLFIRSRCLLVI